MSRIKSSYYSRRDKVVASLDVASRMLERWSADPVMTQLAEKLKSEANHPRSWGSESGAAGQKGRKFSMCHAPSMSMSDMHLSACGQQRDMTFQVEC